MAEFFLTERGPRRQLGRALLSSVLTVAGFGSLLVSSPAQAAVDVVLDDVPDYGWYAGCFGTATGNLMGYWDRSGFPNFYTGPTAEGVAPLDSQPPEHEGIRSLWASRAGQDGRPADLPGHMDDYYAAYESTAADPYVSAGRPEHTPDCLGDFIGLNQNKWTDLNGECDGNIDAYSFVFWDRQGKRRTNFDPTGPSGEFIPDIPSGLRAWTLYRGSKADTFSQLTDFNPTIEAGEGFTFNDLKAEIDAGYPVLLYMQPFRETFRSLPGMERANPNIHGMLAYGYYLDDNGQPYVHFRDSWGSGEARRAPWNASFWVPGLPLPVRGVIGYHPLPRVTRVATGPQTLTLDWEGPSAVLSDLINGTSLPLHLYVVERASRVSPSDFEPVTDPTTEHSVTIPYCCPDETAFFRLRLLESGPLAPPE